MKSVNPLTTHHAVLQFDDSERIPKNLKFEPGTTSASALTQEELDALCEFFLLLDEWDRKKKIA
jgi:hypothetical protein